STASPPPATLNPLGFPETASPPSTGVEPGRFPSDAAAGTNHELGSPVPPARAPRALELASIERPTATSAPLLLRQALTPPSQEQALAGKNLPLEEALQGIPETRRRSLVDAYWQLTAAVGRFYFV